MQKVGRTCRKENDVVLKYKVMRPDITKKLLRAAAEIKDSILRCQRRAVMRRNNKE